MENIAGSIRVEATLEVELPPDEVYRFWRIPENLPRFMERLISATAVDPWRSYWVVRSGESERVAWFVEIVADTEPVLIAWRSMGPEALTPDYSCQARFGDGLVGRGTSLRFECTLQLGSQAVNLLGDDPMQQLSADLVRCRGLMANSQRG